VIVEVWDLSTALPAAKQPDPDAEGGRGLLLVEALTERWGWQHIPELARQGRMGRTRQQDPARPGAELTVLIPAAPPRTVANPTASYP